MWPNPQVPAALVTFTEEILNGKLHFLFSEKLWTLLIAMTNNPSENILDKFTKMSKIGNSMESLIANFLEISTKFVKRFVSSSLLWIHLKLETSQRFSLNLQNFQWSFSAEVKIKLFFTYHVISWLVSHVTRWVDSLTLNQKGYSKNNRTQ